MKPYKKSLGGRERSIARKKFSRKGAIAKVTIKGCWGQERFTEREGPNGKKKKQRGKGDMKQERK